MSWQSQSAMNLPKMKATPQNFKLFRELMEQQYKIDTCTEYNEVKPESNIKSSKIL